MSSSALLRTVLTSAFILLMLASAHLFMVGINAAEVAIAHPDVNEGVPARMLTDRPMVEEIEAVIKKTKAPDKRAVLERVLAEERSGTPVALRTLPVTRFLVYATLGLTFLGVALLWLTSRLKSDTAQTIVGVFGGNLIWTGGIEYGLTIGARTLGIGKTIGVVAGRPVAVYGEYVLLKHTWGFLALVMVYLLFLESSRCPIFLFWRRNVPTMRGPIVHGRIDNYGPRSGFQYATTVWGFYLLLLWAYDEHVFGVYSLMTRATMLLSIAGSVYCAYRLYRQTGWGTSVRYAIAAMIVVWTPIEIAGKWGMLREPWLLLHPGPFVVFFGGLALGTWGLWHTQRRIAAAAVLARAAAAGATTSTILIASAAEAASKAAATEPTARRCPIGRATSSETRLSQIALEAEAAVASAVA